jgi:protein phosphatase PTC2/3
MFTVGPSHVNLTANNCKFKGNLALSRALGDFEFKQTPSIAPEDQIVTANPEIISRTMTDAEEFLVLACDGIWDCMSSQDVIDFVRFQVAITRGDLGRICEQVMDRCLASDSELGGIGCDNMTIIIVAFLRGMSTEEWADLIKKRIADETGKTVEELERDQWSVGFGATNGVGVEVIPMPASNE